MISDTVGPDVARWQYNAAADDYKAERYDRSAWRYNAVLPFDDSLKQRVIHLREQAAAYGQTEKYAKQLENHLLARELATDAGLDSLRRMSAASIGNIIAACRENKKYCGEIDQTLLQQDDRSMSSLPAMDPLLLFFVVVAGGGILWLLFVEEGEGA